LGDITEEEFEGWMDYLEIQNGKKDA